MEEVFLTKMNGNIPTMNVMMKLIASGPMEESLPFRTDTISDKNMNRELISSAWPTFLDMTLISIFRLLKFYSSLAAAEDSISLSLSSRSLFSLFLSSIFSSISSDRSPFRWTSSSSPSKS